MNREMNRDRRSRLRSLSFRGLVLLLALSPVLAAIVPAGRGQFRQTEPAAPQVTVFGLQAVAGEEQIDPMFLSLAPQLRDLLPGHGFTLLGAESQRLAPGDAMTCDLGDDRSMTTLLLDPLDADGKVRLKIRLDIGDRPAFITTVRTPLNQLVFLDKALGDDQRLLIGVGAR